MKQFFLAHKISDDIAVSHGINSYTDLTYLIRVDENSTVNYEQGQIVKFTKNGNYEGRFCIHVDITQEITRMGKDTREQPIISFCLRENNENKFFYFQDNNFYDDIPDVLLFEKFDSIYEEDCDCDCED